MKVCESSNYVSKFTMRLPVASKPTSKIQVSVRLSIMIYESSKFIKTP